MNLLLDSWNGSTDDSLSAIGQSLLYGIVIGTLEGGLVYALMDAIGLFNNVPLYG